MNHTVRTTNTSGFRTRQISGFFVPGENETRARRAPDYGRDEKAEYNTRKGNKPRRLVSVVESRPPHLASDQLKHQEANHG